MLMLLLLSCTPKTPTTIADCDGLYSGKDDCYAKLAPPIFAKDPEAGIEIAEKKISDPTIRDFLYLTVTREIDPSTNRYCEKIKDSVLGDRCRVLVSRPHLHRGLTTGGAAGSSPAAPPPGGPPGSPGAPAMPAPPSEAPPGAPQQQNK